MLHKDIDRRCYLLSKGKDFQAIHNFAPLFESSDEVVTYWVKVKIFKQFTTPSCSYSSNGQLLLTE